MVAPPMDIEVRTAQEDEYETWLGTYIRASGENPTETGITLRRPCIEMDLSFVA